MYRQAYLRGDYRRALQRGDPGLFSGLGRVARRVAGAVFRSTPLGAAVQEVRNIVAPSAPAAPAAALPSFSVAGGASVPSVTTGEAGGGAAVTREGRPRRIRRDGKPYKRPSMNVSNSRAAARAIRRIKGARKLLQRIESSLPRRKASGSHGVITRREAERALRS